ncbi:MAG: recombinase, partial [Actinomycetota bacterium]|nr:recombinase [Actinomycetota bacterium]
RGVTATDCAKIVRKNGSPSSQRQTLLAQKLYGLRGPDYTVYAHGREREPHIAAWVADEFGIPHNTSLCVGEDNRHMATPDAVGREGIAEFKTATQPITKALRTYSDQLQWQMHVLHTERVLFVVEDRHSFAREWTWVHRDERRITVLVHHADRFIAELEERQAARRAAYAEP